MLNHQIVHALAKATVLAKFIAVCTVLPLSTSIIYIPQFNQIFQENVTKPHRSVITRGMELSDNN